MATTALAATVLAGSPPASAAGGTAYTLGADQPVQLSCLLGPLGPEPAEITAHFTGPAAAGRGDTVTLTEFSGTLTLTGFVSAILQAAGIDGLRGAADGHTFDLSLSASAGSLSPPSVTGFTIPETATSAGKGNDPISLPIVPAASSAVSYTAPGNPGSVSFATTGNVPGIDDFTFRLQTHYKSSGWQDLLVQCHPTAEIPDFSPSMTIL